MVGTSNKSDPEIPIVGFQIHLVFSQIDYPLVNEHSHGKSPFLMGKSTISMAIFNS
jgi:hypothetical protein